MCLFVRNILWDLDIPQEAATVAYEDNDGCTSMGNAQKPTPRTRHMSGSTLLLTHQITSPKHYPASFSIDMLITFLVMYHPLTRRYILKQLPHTAISTRTLIHLSLTLSPLPLLLVLHGLLLPYKMTYGTILGY